MEPIEAETERFRKAILRSEWPEARQMLTDYHRTLEQAFREAPDRKKRAALRDAALELVRWARRAVLVNSAHLRTKRARLAAVNSYRGAGSQVMQHSWKLHA
ncbi:MAG: hypothetical protein ABFD60_06840 [Bryobacteraceae bacterium]